MEKIKVLHIIEALGGGVYTYFTDLSHVFGNDDRVETTIIYSDKRREVDPTKIREDFHSNVKLIKVSMQKEISPINDLKATYKLRQAVHRLKPDVIHLHSSKISVLGRLAYFLSFSKAKLFYTPHGYAFLKEDISKNKRIVYKKIEEYGQRIFGGKTIACGDTEFTYAKKMGSSLLVRNGINVNAIRGLRINIKNEKLTIGILGRITYARNPELFNRLALKHPEIDFLWIGDGEMKEKLTAANITITGWFVNKTEGIGHLNKIDIYLQTSLWEGLPIAVLEAMALEKPVLATKVIGNIDVVEHGKTGFLFTDESDFHLYLDQLIDKDTRKIMGRNGFERCQEFFNAEENFSAMIDVYHDELGNNK